MTFQTRHRFLHADARDLGAIADDSVHLVVTSPPYPMIAMWDAMFCALDPQIGPLLEAHEGFAAFDRMHALLDPAWKECARVLTPGGFLALNIGDATRSMGDSFCLFPNAARIGLGLREAGLCPLPDILWHKPTNAPNKYMGSGMLPAGAYVTYEHEYILIFRKGGCRRFPSAQMRLLRRRSAFFWEERNAWFSDVWTDLRGTGQELGGVRKRSAAFPLELPHRLVAMYSLYGDTVLDPFAGTGTTLLAAASLARHSIGVETIVSLRDVVADTMRGVVDIGNARVDARLRAHRAFVAQCEGRAFTAEDGPLTARSRTKALVHRSTVYDFPVVTAQEEDLELVRPIASRRVGEDTWEVDHEAGPGL
jgi:modification methylase